MKAIETFYRGYRFRSRLEARWAVFLDCCDIKWQYEPEGYDLGNGRYYLPDFFLPIPLERQEYPNSGYWLEIKGQMPTQDELDKLVSLTHQTKHTGWLVFGQPGEHKRFFTHHKGNKGWMEWNAIFDDSAEIPDELFDLYTIAIQLSVKTELTHVFDKVDKAILIARQVRFEQNDYLLRQLEKNWRN